MVRWLTRNGKPHWKLANGEAKDKADQELRQERSEYLLNYATTSSFCLLSDAKEWLQQEASTTLRDRIGQCASRPENGRRKKLKVAAPKK